MNRIHALLFIALGTVAVAAPLRVMERLDRGVVAVPAVVVVTAVVVLLNQTGQPQAPEVEAGEIEAWRSHLSKYKLVREVLTLDAFARCWVQEDRLMGVLAPLMEG